MRLYTTFNLAFKYLREISHKSQVKQNYFKFFLYKNEGFCSQKCLILNLVDFEFTLHEERIKGYRDIVPDIVECTFFSLSNFIVVVLYFS